MLSQISDEDIRQEYQRRFEIRAGEQIGDAESAANHLRQYVPDQSRESFIVLFLNGNNRVITTETMFTGTLTNAAVYPREIVKRILANHAAAVILSHNHPSSNLNPSSDDKMITSRISAATNTIDVKLHDHIILGNRGFYSFAEHGLI